MPSRTLSINKDSLLAKAGSSVGGGDDEHLPIGSESGYQFGAVVKFNMNWTSVTQITSATLHMRTSTGAHITTFTSDPDVWVRRMTADWTENSERSSYDSPPGTGWTASGADYDSVAADDTTSGQILWDVGGGGGPSESTWYSVDITTMLEAWAPSSVLKSDGVTPGSGLANHGLSLFQDSGDVEFSSRESANNPYITLNYLSTDPPDAPTINSPTASEVVASQTPTISITHSGGTVLSFDMQVDFTTGPGVEPDWTSLIWSTTDDTSDLTNPITKVVGSSLTRGNYYALRARTANVDGDGPWSATRYFRIGTLPTGSITTPTTGHTAKMYYDAGSNTTPKFEPIWSFFCADGHTQTGADIKIYADSGGSPGSLLHTHNYSGSGTTSKVTGYAPTNGTKYHLSVTPTCSLLTGSESSKVITRARWGRASYYVNLGAAPTGWGTPTYNVTLPSNTAAAVEYAVSADASAEPTTWSATLSGLALDDHLWHRVTMMGWGSATPTTPTFLDITMPYSSVVITPDNWTLDGQCSIDESTYVYGTQCLKITGDGTINTAIQVLTGLIVGQSYVVSGRIKSLGASFGVIEIRNNALNELIAATATISATQEFGQLDANGNDISKVYSSVFVATAASVTVRCVGNGAGGTFAWFDALKLEQSAVVTPWTPGFVGRGVIVDAGGIQVDASAGGLLRARGSTGGARDVLEVGSNGLRFGMDSVAEISSPAANILKLGTGSLRAGGTSFPGSPTSDDLFYRSDLNMWFFYDGTRWLSTQVFVVSSSTEANATSYFIASSTSKNRVMVASMVTPFGTDVWIEAIALGIAISSGGTALSGSHKWVLDFMVDNAAIPATSLASISIDSGSSGIFKSYSVDVGALRGAAATNPVISMNITKTGTPGDLNNLAPFNVFFRIVTT